MPQFAISEPEDAALTALTEALDQVDIGILLLDRNLRARFLNRRQIEILDLPPDTPRAGAAFRDLLIRAGAKFWFAVPRGEVGDRLDQLEDAVRAGSTPPDHIDLADGSRLLFACKACPDGGRILTYTDVSRESRPEALLAMEQINAELRFNNETMEDHAAHLASLAEETDESARRVAEAKRELEREVQERRLLEARLREMATTDGLTGALNRSGFLALAQNELDKAPAQDRGMALMMLDVDHFKAINDRYGHAGGDRALKHLVTLLGARTRRSDLLGRLGGEEFAILLPGIVPEEAERRAERLVADVAASPAQFADTAIDMTVSIGLTFVTLTDHSVEHVIARADDALYRAKRGGRNRVVKDHPAEAA
jgi:diguanylate cyclase (GGDEF)-like protein